MLRSWRRAGRRFIGIAVALILLVLFFRRSFLTPFEYHIIATPLRPEKHPISEDWLPQPPSSPADIPAIQCKPKKESPAAKALRQSRLKEVRDAFLHAWGGYKQEAWAMDEVQPVSGGSKTRFCGWAATLVDTLDTLLIMELPKEFESAVQEVGKLNFTATAGCTINTFESTIRHLGGMLSAWDLSGRKYGLLVEKAVELAEVLFTAFDTPNRMPIPFLSWSATNPKANTHKASSNIGLATIGSLSLEFTRLCQITGNPKYFDAVQRVTNELEKWQNETSFPGMWPLMVNTAIVDPKGALVSPNSNPTWEEAYSFGALADSTYEYFPKQYLLLGGTSQYRKMYLDFIDIAKKHLFFRPMTIGNEDILLSGKAYKSREAPSRLKPDTEHLACFVGGMLAIAGKVFSRPEDVEIGAKLADGCIWAYQNTATGIMPEEISVVPCANETNCPWDEGMWLDAISRQYNVQGEAIYDTIASQNLTPGFVSVPARGYLLRPEAIESIFILHRTTCAPHWASAGWSMFQSIQAFTTTPIANSAIDDATSSEPKKLDSMESFWLAETLKYFYLLYSEFDKINLDEWVLNTEAHPLRRPLR